MRKFIVDFGGEEDIDPYDDIRADLPEFMIYGSGLNEVTSICKGLAARGISPLWLVKYKHKPRRHANAESSYFAAGVIRGDGIVAEDLHEPHGHYRIHVGERLAYQADPIENVDIIDIQVWTG